jgi:hypothetical protein
MRRVVGEKPHPRGVIMGFEGKAATALESEFATFKRISKLTEIDVQEWDVLVTNDDLHREELGSLFVVTFAYRLPSSTSGMLHRSRPTPARHFIIPDDLTPSVHGLVQEILLPALQSTPENCLVCLRNFDAVPKDVRAFAESRDGLAFAGEYERPGGGWVWTLPPVKDVRSCVRAALVDWNRHDPSRFPLKLWSESPDWATVAELSALADIAEVEQERVTLLSALDVRKVEASQRLEVARVAAEGGQRRLLTAQGEELTGAIAKTLRELSFEVRDMDCVHPQGDLREDLRITHKSKPGWLALAEVKGYKGGAAVNDLLKMGRWCKRYIQESGVPPSASWYVVNQFLGRDPSERPPVFASNPDELSTFSDDGGLAIDTADLFKLARNVHSGTSTTEAAVRLLIESTGRLQL